MKISRLIFFFLVALALLTLGPTVPPASTAGGSSTFQFLAGSGFLCGFGPGTCPDISSADNGDTIEITGSGTVSTQLKSAGGGGTFTWKDSSGNILASGTWTAQSLASFVPYLVLPDNIAGGEALIKVHLLGGFDGDAILTVTCAIGAPPGHMEGIFLNIQDVINFNKKVSGITIYIKQ